MEHNQYLENVLRAELKRQKTRWSARYKRMSDSERRRVLGGLLVNRLVAENHSECRHQDEGLEPYEGDPEIMATKGPLGNSSGGGRRVVRGTKSLS